jgi:hypothetical protein
MTTTQVTVEIMGSDPNNLVGDCQSFCDNAAPVEPTMEAVTERAAELELDPAEARLMLIGENLLSQYLETIDARTTGAEALTVCVR